MRYLDPAEYLVWGLSAETSDDWVASASAMIDGFCRRPSLGVTQYVERMRLARRWSFCGLQQVQLSYAPLSAVAPALSALVGVRVRLGSAGGAVLHSALLAEAVGAFGLRGTWSALDVSTIDVSAGGELTLAPHLFGVPYDEVEVTYTAGHGVIPDAVKAACAQIVRGAQAMPALTVKRSQVDGLQMEYFQSALLDASVQAMLRPYVSTRLG